MPIRCDEYSTACVLTLEGDLTGDECAALRRLADERILHHRTINFVVDAEKCPFIDSEGLESLLWLHQRIDGLGGQLKLSSLDDTCRKILQMTRLDHRFECTKDLAAALKNL
jgi:anti-sigma B factor antagonist